MRTSLNDKSSEGKKRIYCSINNEFDYFNHNIIGLHLIYFILAEISTNEKEKSHTHIHTNAELWQMEICIKTKKKNGKKEEETKESPKWFEHNRNCRNVETLN